VGTYYHQYQREQKVDKETGEMYIETTLEDVAEANKLLKETFLSTMPNPNLLMSAFCSRTVFSGSVVLKIEVAESKLQLLSIAQSRIKSLFNFEYVPTPGNLEYTALCLPNNLVENNESRSSITIDNPMHTDKSIKNKSFFDSSSTGLRLTIFITGIVSKTKNPTQYVFGYWSGNKNRKWCFWVILQEKFLYRY
jgi:hypothetical protein